MGGGGWEDYGFREEKYMFSWEQPFGGPPNGPWNLRP